MDVRFYPDGNTNYSRLWTSDDDFAGEATFRITSDTNTGMTTRTFFTVAAGWTKLEVLSPSTSNPNGGFLESAEDYSRIGYDNDNSDNQFMWFDASGMTTHYGKWWDSAFASSTWGVHAGHGSPAPVGLGWRSITGPRCRATWGRSRCVQSGKAIYWWAHRHNGSASPCL
ncbi:hypothetical protein [Nonomuraea sp. NPDC048901]|uniref:hypothetical protein n=1 Tax=unclassified Nonomuraea TaxID=2593643 RepID=UPI0033DDD9BF